ncbi:MAG: ankyrin repeat domain-containing protein, partial [Pseudomonadota bacterium]|nr:ankyrin repeat domain-containing protein [Pseudomonadota bacterium]
LSFQGNKPEAIAKYYKATNPPRRKDRNDRAKHDAFLNLTRLLIELGRYQEADDAYANFGEKFPEELCTPLMQAEIRAYYLADYDGAIQRAVKASQQGCHAESHAMSIAYYLKWMNSSGDEAISSLRRANGLAPTDHELFSTLSMYQGTHSIIPELTKRGRDINHQNSEGYNAIAIQVSYGNFEAVKRLLSYGADLNQPNHYQVTPFMLAVATGSTHIVRLMMRYNPDLNLTLPNGQRLIDWARGNGYHDIAELLSAEYNS